MSVPNIVIDTNVIIAALRSKKGASNKLLALVGSSKFEIHDSVALFLNTKMLFNAREQNLVYQKTMFPFSLIHCVQWHIITRYIFCGDHRCLM